MVMPVHQRLQLRAVEATRRTLRTRRDHQRHGARRGPRRDDTLDRTVGLERVAVEDHLGGGGRGLLHRADGDVVGERPHAGERGLRRGEGADGGLLQAGGEDEVVVAEHRVAVEHEHARLTVEVLHPAVQNVHLAVQGQPVELALGEAVALGQAAVDTTAAASAGAVHHEGDVGEDHVGQQQNLLEEPLGGVGGPDDDDARVARLLALGGEPRR
eukprot:COSAG04_NODE_6000_length_1437_cov_1.401345_1_plen_213_part_10